MCKLTENMGEKDLLKKNFGGFPPIFSGFFLGFLDFFFFFGFFGFFRFGSSWVQFLSQSFGLGRVGFALCPNAFGWVLALAKSFGLFWVGFGLKSLGFLGQGLEEP